MATNQIVSGATTIDCDILDGRVEQLRPAVEIYERPGLDSYGARTIGTRARQMQIRVVKFKDTYAHGVTFAQSVRALVGKYVTLNYEVSSQTDSNVLVVDVLPARGGDDIRAGIDGSGNSYIVELTLVAQKT